MLDAEIVLNARRAVRSGKKTPIQLRAELSLTQSAIHNLLTGATYPNVPEALTRTRCATISDEKVIAIRKRYRERGGHLAALGRKYGLSGRNFESLLLGRGSFSNIPHPLSEKHISLPIALNKTTVLGLRQRYEEAKGRLSLLALAAEFKTTSTTIRKALKGDAPYDRYKGFEATEVLNNCAYLRTKEVQEMRHYYRVNLGKVSLPDLAKKYDTPVQMVRKALLGQGVYSKIPNPVEAIIAAANRKLEPEVVLFMRFVYLSGNVTQKQMAGAYGLSQGYVHQILSGICYGHVPEAICAKDRMGKPRRLTTEQVVWARRMYRTGQITMREIQKEIGIETQAMASMLRGLSYKEIPGAVPERIKFRRRGMVMRPRAFLHWEPHEIPLAKAALEEAISRAGGHKGLAKALGLDSARRVYDWCRQGYVAGPQVGAFSRLTGIEPARLRPDLCRDQESGLHIAIPRRPPKWNA